MKIIENKDIDQKLTDQWSNNKYISSHFEAYTCAIHEQEIGTKDLIYRRELKNNQQPTNDNKCCLCKVHVVDVMHIISSCIKMPSRYYLPIQHVIAKYFYKAIRREIQNAKLNTRETSLLIRIVELNISGMLLLKQL